MDVVAEKYPSQLLGILVAISEADFVSFDLELTGIPSHLPGKEPWKPRVSARKTLEDRYQETKLAADRYQIIQVGITCAQFNYLTNKYVLRPYNITLSPLLDESLRLDIEREIHIQSGAATFLLSHGFDMGAPFREGVQYLSREEAYRAQQMANNRLDKKNEVEDLNLKRTDIQAIDFVKRVRGAIKVWKDSNELSALEITSHTGLRVQPPGATISRFEKRLVHQLVRADFPELVTISRQECIRIIRYDEKREEENRNRIKQRVKENIARQTGFRWVFEALAADGDIRQADPFYFGNYYNPGASGHIIAHDASSVKERFDRARERLQKHQPVLVGHNMFTDLVYFYRSFIGELPDSLDAFLDRLHSLFPRIIDTKYLATHAEGDLNASPTLQEIAEKVQYQPLPDIVTHPEFPKYHDAARFHEAGYDSLLTATILLRLSAKMQADLQPSPDRQQEDSNSDASFKTAAEQPLLNGHTEPKAPPPSHQQIPRRGLLAVKKKTKKDKKKTKADNRPPPAQSRFHTSNMFDHLTLNEDSEPDTTSLSETDQANPSGRTPTVTTSWQDEPYTLDTENLVPIEAREREPMEMIPAWDSEFWKTFGNTLRVYGTQEAVLKIADWAP